MFLKKEDDSLRNKREEEPASEEGVHGGRKW